MELGCSTMRERRGRRTVAAKASARPAVSPTDELYLKSLADDRKDKIH